jgi:hypothetical protein
MCIDPFPATALKHLILTRGNIYELASNLSIAIKVAAALWLLLHKEIREWT